MTDADLIAFLKAAYPNGSWPRPFHILEGLEKIAAGSSPAEAAKSVGTIRHLLEKASQASDPEFAVLGLRSGDLGEDDLRRARLILGQLLIGRAAEIAFEHIYRGELGPSAEFKLVDLREGRTDTDYRILNGMGRPIYRVNIKFIGSLFRQAKDMVGLDPEDCFPLATYKIFSALQKQEEEHLPYFFAIVAVANLTAVSIQELLAETDAKIVAMFAKSPRVSGKRNIEDKVVERIVAGQSPAFTKVYDRIREAEWYVLSARRANLLLRTFFEQRVFALKVRGFTQKFRHAEVDMHFSLKNHLVTFKQFLQTLKQEGQTKMATLLERGTL
jgi:hypothetical protein